MKVSQTTIAEKAMQLAILDAIENSGCKCPKMFAEYVKTEKFEKSVRNYIAMFNEQF